MKSDHNYMIFKALANVVRTKGNEIQNHGLSVGVKSITTTTINEIKK
jgi:hypothetical protein